MLPEQQNEKQQDLEFEEELYKILNKFTQGSTNWKIEPLDGDEVDILTEIIRNQLNLINGNITPKEYEELMDNIHGGQV